MNRRDDTVLEKVIVRMSPEMHLEVKRRAAEEDRTMAHTIRRAVRQYLDRGEGGKDTQ